MKKACAYIRVSTDEQTEYSLDAQLRAIKIYAEKNGYYIPDEYVFSDRGISGRKAKNRGEFLKMIKVAKQKPTPFEVIFVHKFDRFARNREDSILYKSLLKRECGVKVISINEPLEDDKISVLMEAIIEAMGEYYSLNLSEEVMKGLTEKARRGEYCGLAPIGYINRGGKLLIDDETVDIVREIFCLHKKMTATGIAKHLNETGRYTKNNKNWTYDSIKRILTNKAYIGTVVYNKHNDKIEVENAHNKIITVEKFNATQVKLEKEMNRIKKGVKQHKCKSFLHSIAVCSECGKKLTISKSKNSYQFRCSQKRHQKCSVGNSISAKKLENLVIDELEKVLDFEIEITYSENKESNIESLILQKNKTENKLIRIKEAYINEIDTIDEYKQNKYKVSEELKNIEQKIKELGKTKTYDFIYLSDILKSEYIDNENKRLICNILIFKLVVNLKNKCIEIIYNK